MEAIPALNKNRLQNHFFQAINAHVKCNLVLQPNLKLLKIYISAMLKVSIIVQGGLSYSSQRKCNGEILLHLCWVACLSRSAGTEYVYL